MAFRVVIGKKGRLGGKQPPAITLNFRLGRIVILSNIYLAMRQRFGQEVHYVRLLIDDEQPDIFLIQPCADDAHGARRLDMTPGASPSISARYLFNKLGLPRDGFRRCPVVWDNEHGGWLVHWKESIPVEDAIKPESIRVTEIPSDKKKKGKGSI
jgi:hypothetical protein